jgi:hypothetical protein
LKHVEGPFLDQEFEVVQKKFGIYKKVGDAIIVDGDLDKAKALGPEYKEAMVEKKQTAVTIARQNFLNQLEKVFDYFEKSGIFPFWNVDATETIDLLTLQYEIMKNTRHKELMQHLSSDIENHKKPFSLFFFDIMVIKAAGVISTRKADIMDVDSIKALETFMLLRNEIEKSDTLEDPQFCQQLFNFGAYYACMKTIGFERNNACVMQMLIMINNAP